MDEYIKKEDVLKLLNRNSITKKITLADGISIYDSVKNLPTAEVVPKSEVEEAEAEIERLKHILDCYALQYGTVMDKYIVIERARAELASEIFAEIESKKDVP